MNNKKQLKLYNVLFPAWMFTLLPPMWLVVIPGNFVIDSVVLLISMWALKIADKGKWYKKHIFKIFAFGFLADIMGSAFLLLLLAIFGDIIFDLELLFTLLATVVSALLIFVFNYCFTFKKSETPLRFRLSLIFAIATAPYTFMIPTTWLY